MAKRCIDVCSASTARIEPATVRYCLLVIKPAAPRYALVPTPSSTEERVIKLGLRGHVSAVRL